MCRRNQQIFDATLCPLILDCSFYCKYHHRSKYFKIISPNICKIIWTFEKVVYCIPISPPRLSVYICDSLGHSSMVLSLKSFFSSFFSLLSFYYLFLDRVFSCRSVCLHSYDPSDSPLQCWNYRSAPLYPTTAEFSV